MNRIFLTFLCLVLIMIAMFFYMNRATDLYSNKTKTTLLEINKNLEQINNSFKQISGITNGLKEDVSVIQNAENNLKFVVVKDNLEYQNDIFGFKVILPSKWFSNVREGIIKFEDEKNFAVIASNKIEKENINFNFVVEAHKEKEFCNEEIDNTWVKEIINSKDWLVSKSGENESYYSITNKEECFILRFKLEPIDISKTMDLSTGIKELPELITNSFIIK